MIEKDMKENNIGKITEDEFNKQIDLLNISNRAKHCMLNAFIFRDYSNLDDMLNRISAKDVAGWRYAGKMVINELANVLHDKKIINNIEKWIKPHKPQKKIVYSVKCECGKTVKFKQADIISKEYIYE